MHDAALQNPGCSQLAGLHRMRFPEKGSSLCKFQEKSPPGVMQHKHVTCCTCLHPMRLCVIHPLHVINISPSLQIQLDEWHPLVTAIASGCSS